MKMYRLSLFEKIIMTEYEVLKTSEKSVWFVNNSGQNIRELKSSAYYLWFGTYNEARIYAINRLERKIESAERLIEDNKKALLAFENEYKTKQKAEVVR